MNYRVIPLATGPYEQNSIHFKLERALQEALRELNSVPELKRKASLLQVFREHGIYYGIFQVTPVAETGEIDAR